MKVSNSRTAKLAAYAAMGVGGLTFGATAANADIIVTDLTGSELVFTSTNPVSLDIDNDGTDDFQFELGTFGPNFFSTFSYQLNFGNAAADNRVAGFDFGGYGALQNLAIGSSVSGKSFSLNNAYLVRAYTNYNPSSSYGDFLAGTGFAGVQFLDGTGNTRFGWVEMEYAGTVANGDFADVSVTVSRYAYAIDEPISAGQTESIPEPTALGLLALGGVGVLARRRRKQEE